MQNGTERPVNRPEVNWALFAARVIVGIIFVMHGSQKMFGAFGGPGLSGVMSPQGPGGGGVVGLLVAIGEFFGGLGLVFGFLSRFSAGVLIVVMLTAIAQVHGRNGFFLQDKGYEFCLALIGLLVPILIAGPGQFAAVRLLPLTESAAVKRIAHGLE
ncbi:MAG TPA: DoxX family protein [Armatimonadota bacterium]